MELIDKCVHCGKPKGEHQYWQFGVDFETRACPNHSGTRFKSITVSAAEKNAVANLEVMLGTLALLQRSAKLVTPNNFISLAITELSKAIEDSTPKE